MSNLNTIEEELPNLLHNLTPEEAQEWQAESRRQDAYSDPGAQVRPEHGSGVENGGTVNRPSGPTYRLPNSFNKMY